MIKRRNKNYKVKRFFYYLLFFLFLVFFLVIIFFHLFYLPKRAAVIFFDVGQGDAALIRTPTGQKILIDGGPDNSVLQKIGKFLPYFSRQIDLIIISHYHDDHVTGLIEVIRRYDVKNIIYGQNLKSGFILKTLLAEAELKNKDKTRSKQPKILALEDKMEINFSNTCRLWILNPLSLEVPKDDNNSLLTKLSCAGHNFLFSGDNNYKVEQALLRSDFNLQSDIFKVSHHGSKTANTKDFLKTLSPKLLIISVGALNRFGHPSQEILNLVSAFGIKLQRTDLDGDIFLRL